MTPNEISMYLITKFPDMLLEDVELKTMLITFKAIIDNKAKIFIIDNRYDASFEDGQEPPDGAEPADPYEFYNELIKPRILRGIERNNWHVIRDKSGEERLLTTQEMDSNQFFHYRISKREALDKFLLDLQKD